MIILMMMDDLFAKAIYRLPTSVVVVVDDDDEHDWTVNLDHLASKIR